MKYKIILLMLVCLELSSCSTHDETYYALHPAALEEAMVRCPAESLSELSCDKLKQIAIHMNQLAYHLRMDQQGYGKEIIALQETAGVYQKKLEQNPKQPDVEQAWHKLNQDLTERLFVVKWLASPGGK